MKPIHIQRLKKLARFLRKVPPEKFDLSLWSSDKPPMRQDCKCDTVACAVGWATVIFDELRLKNSEPVFKNKSGWTAVSEFFGLSHYMSQRLFDQYSYRSIEEMDDDYEWEVITPSIVADRINEFVKAKGQL